MADLLVYFFILPPGDVMASTLYTSSSTTTQRSTSLDYLRFAAMVCLDYALSLSVYVLLANNFCVYIYRDECGTFLPRNFYFIESLTRGIVPRGTAVSSIPARVSMYGGLSTVLNGKYSQKHE